MTQAYIITSSIETNSCPLTYSSVRSIFTSQERLRQTVATVASIDQAANSNAVIYLIDTSENWEQYSSFFQYQQNLKFISVKDQFPEIYHESTTHANKSRCETLITKSFFDRYSTELQSFDSFVKISGRYFLDGSFKATDIQSDKIYFKQAWQFNWQDWWKYDRVRQPDSSVLKQYCSALFAWGQQHHETIRHLYQQIETDLALPDQQHYDLETLLYFYSIPYNHCIVETSWLIYGWLGPNGNFVRQ